VLLEIRGVMYLARHLSSQSAMLVVSSVAKVLESPMGRHARACQAYTYTSSEESRNQKLFSFQLRERYPEKQLVAGLALVAHMSSCVVNKSVNLQPGC
jgi:hypothetical protein